jgi:hypothetical protein
MISIGHQTGLFGTLHGTSPRLHKSPTLAV